ncbi:MAG: BrnA antitoxin family protein [Beijerinckiaceae bacterium]
MAKRYAKALSAAEIARMPDASIDMSDIPELDDAFWSNARLVQPDKTQSVTLRVRESVLEAFKRGGKGYQTRMNAVLESYINSVIKRG